MSTWKWDKLLFTAKPWHNNKPIIGYTLICSKIPYSTLYNEFFDYICHSVQHSLVSPTAVILPTIISSYTSHTKGTHTQAQDRQAGTPPLQSFRPNHPFLRMFNVKVINFTRHSSFFFWTKNRVQWTIYLTTQKKNISGSSRMKSTKTELGTQKWEKKANAARTCTYVYLPAKFPRTNTLPKSRQNPSRQTTRAQYIFSRSLIHTPHTTH
jgi:hypothetical protein